ncbi:uncharacterized protein LOC118236334 isoform X2 [Anguilla anguilla]|nr:uncharacterized protein LOC118236334 isoform X2 [Anguilla anguilla]XP_035290521.1 uncharacterized protein LOC118236334 isoform X2 [Anguilla anguilla]XP_035290529.1 uncharacterized protein LOC118236334 isoform X2 [Anguilla anguilla]
MSLRKCFLFVLLTTVFRSVGNQAEHGQPVQRVQVQVKLGDTAVLPCNVSAHMNGETEDGLYIRWDTNDGLVCEFTEGKSHPHGDYRNRTEISKEENSKHLYHLIINKTRLSDNGKFYCILGKPDLFIFGVASVQLIVQGLVENRELHEGENLSIPLCCLSSPYIEFCGPAGNSTADGVCQGLTVRNGSLTLSNVTAKDQGKYIVREKMGGGVVLTLTLTLKTKTIPFGNQSTDWRFIVGVIAGICVLLLLQVLLVYISVRAINLYTKRKMERETRRAEQPDEQIPLSEINSSGDVEEK